MYNRGEETVDTVLNFRHCIIGSNVIHNRKNHILRERFKFDLHFVLFLSIKKHDYII